MADDEPKVDPDDGLLVDEVGLWANEKHTRLRSYINISRGARRKFLPPANSGGASYIDLYCGTARLLIRDTGSIIDGSPLVAYKAAYQADARFSEIHLADIDDNKRTIATTRIARAGGSARSYVGPAQTTANQVVAALNPYGLHFAFLDPYNLDALPFSVVATLSQLQRMDILIHVSVQDLQRNLDRYTASTDQTLEKFAPGWRAKVDTKQSQAAIRAQLFEYWLELIRERGMSPARGIALVSGERNQRLYWLVFVSKSEFANALWDEISSSSGQKTLL